jgi:hypothetical protein
MTSVRLRTCAAGGALALTAGLLAGQGSVLGADLPHTALLGAALGAVLGLVPDRTVVGRTGGFLAGFAAAWVGYALRAGVFPDVPLGRALASVIVVSAITAVAVASAGRLPLWSGLVGAGALLGAYETTFVTTPTGFLSDSMTAATTVLVSAALGLLVATTVEGLLDTATSPAPGAKGHVAVPAPRASVDADADAGLDITSGQETSR